MEMTLKMAVAIGLKITIILLMLSLGLQIKHQSLILLWRNPRLLLGSIAAAFLIVPVVTYLVFQILPLSFGTKAGLWTVSITPGAPMIYRAVIKRGIGNAELAASFQITVALLVIILAPAWLAIIGAIYGKDYGIPSSVLLKQVSTIQFIPILVGIALHRLLPDITERAVPTLVSIGSISLNVFIVILLAVLGLRIIGGIHIWTILAAALMAASAIIGGHLLAGPELSTRLTIANANAQRNPGLALAITAWKVPEHQGASAVAVVVYLIISIALTAIYTSIYGKSANIRVT